MSDNDNNEKINIKFELPQVANEVSLPLAKSIGKTLSLAWDGLFMGVETWYCKKKIDQENYLKLYKENIQKELNDIPEDNIQEPKMNIMGPALETSRYYFEEEQYRIMFSKLIAKSCDNRFNTKTHPFFVDAIKQMSPLDAKILSLFKAESIIPVASYRYKLANNNGYNDFIPYVYYFNKDYFDPRINSSAIINLQRLGFITIDFTRHILEHVAYDLYYNDPFYIKQKSLIKRRFNDPTQICEYNDVIIKKGVMQLTPLGLDFLNICME